MTELRLNDVVEVKAQNIENYRNIKPENGMKIEDAKKFVEGLFADGRQDMLSDGHVLDNKEGVSDKPRYIRTLNESLENDRHPITGVPFERKMVELPNGEKIEGVFPNFDSKFDAKIPEEMYLKSDKEQFKECNKQLLNEINSNKELKKQFTAEQIEQISDGVSDGTAPDGFVWNHDVEPGKLQLVDVETHAHTGHTGGRAVWGGGSDNR